MNSIARAKNESWEVWEQDFWISSLPLVICFSFSPLLTFFAQVIRSWSLLWFVTSFIRFVTNFTWFATGCGAAFFHCVIFVQGRLAFTNNTGDFTGGALLIVASQIILFPDTELLFLGNHVLGMGGAVCVLVSVDELTHANNPDCFLAYSDPLLPPSKWKVKRLALVHSNQTDDINMCKWRGHFLRRFSDNVGNFGQLRVKSWF